VLVVGVGNSGADIAMEVNRDHRTWLAGKETGHVPFHIEGQVGRRMVRVVRFMGHRVLNLGTPIGRRVLPKMATKATPLIRVKPRDLTAAGVERIPRVAGARDGWPVLGDGRVLDDVANVIWCTGFLEDFSWIDAPAFDELGAPMHRRGVVDAVSGLYFVGLAFQYAATSDVITGVGRDARHVVDHLVSRHPGVGGSQVDGLARRRAS
jgi:putative flavoprotein involved in K+ transport